jgi:hypothetical protein
VTLACLCGGLLEALVFTLLAGFAWLGARFNLWRANRCQHKCCAASNPSARAPVDG